MPDTFLPDALIFLAIMGSIGAVLFFGLWIVETIEGRSRRLERFIARLGNR